MKIVCDACGAKYSIADEKVAGKVFKIRCKKCSNIIVVRGNAGEEAAAAEAEQPNKDTKVFDYAGYDSPQEAMAAAAEGEWHLVIDQEQVGPMTSEEVRTRFAAGEVDAESYIWKEGFGDWERIPDVPEFADLESGGEAPAAAAAAGGDGLFGDDASASAGPSDLFGGDAGGASGGADLFGGANESGGSDLFGSSSSSVGEHTGEVEMSADAEAQLKGQRNENSVLFSLGNLAALASDSPKPAAAAPSSLGGGGSGGGSIANTGGSEGSGLIDIRSMASVYLADKKQPGIAATPAGSADDLPVFTQSAFESASPVLLPTQGGGTDKKLLYTLIGVIAALGLAAVVLVIIVLSGGDDKKSDEVATGELAGEVEDGTEPAAGDDDDGKPAVGADTEDGTPEPVATDTAEPPATEETTETAAKPVSPTNKPPKPRGNKPPKPRGNKPVKPPKPPKPESSGGGGSCDEVTCLVDPGKACCRKYNKTPSNGGGGSISNLPEKPTRGDITKGIGKVRGRVTSCGDKHGGKGTVKVKMKIGGSGKIVSASASGGGSALRSCVVSAVKRAKFKKTQKGMTVTYPFVFR